MCDETLVGIRHVAAHPVPRHTRIPSLAGDGDNIPHGMCPPPHTHTPCGVVHGQPLPPMPPPVDIQHSACSAVASRVSWPRVLVARRVLITSTSSVASCVSWPRVLVARRVLITSTSSVASRVSWPRVLWLAVCHVHVVYRRFQVPQIHP